MEVERGSKKSAIKNDRREVPTPFAPGRPKSDGPSVLEGFGLVIPSLSGLAVEVLVCELVTVLASPSDVADDWLRKWISSGWVGGCWDRIPADSLVLVMPLSFSSSLLLFSFMSKAGSSKVSVGISSWYERSFSLPVRKKWDGSVFAI